MATVTVQLTSNAAICLDPLQGTQITPQGVLLSLAGRCPGDVLNCAVIPLDKVDVVIQSLQLVAQQAAAPRSRP